MKDEDLRFMKRAIDLARRGWGQTHPNPMVGAVITEAGRAVGEGYHREAGRVHAEIAALEDLGRRPREGAVLYTTMEPCSSHGRTPPCTEAIIVAGFKRVVIGATDPNPRHDGRGRDRLREAGVEVEAGVLDEDCTDLNLIFNHWITTQTPLFAGKAALTLDGKIATRTGHSKWITGPEARLDVMEWRRLFPAIAVGANTVLHDDPRLTSRRDGEDAWCPRRFVFDARLTTIPARGELPGLFCDGHRENTVVVTGEKANEARAKRLTSLGIELWTFPLDGAGVSFRSFRDRCVAEGITGVFFEGGAGIFEGLFKSRQMDYFFTYRAPVIFGDDESLSVFGGETVPKVTDGIRLTSVRHLILGEDTLTRGFVVYSNR